MSTAFWTERRAIRRNEGPARAPTCRSATPGPATTSPGRRNTRRVRRACKPPRRAAQNAAVAAEGDEIELHALDPDLGLVLDHEVEAAAIVGVLDAIELDADLFISCGRCDRQQDLQNDERTQHATHGGSPRSLVSPSH